MKKSSILTLALAALLAACSKSAPKTFFDSIRARKVSNATKQEVMSRHDEVQTDIEYTEDYSRYHFENGEWQLDEANLMRFNHRTRFSLHKEMPIMFFETKSFAAEQYMTEFQIASVGGQIQFVGTVPAQYQQNAKKLYNTIYNSIFSWKASFLTGWTHYMAFTSDMQMVYLPNNAKNFFYEKLSLKEAPEMNPGYFDVVKSDGTSTYNYGGITYTFTEYGLGYKDYILSNFYFDYSIEYIDGDEKTFMRFSVENFSIDFNDSI